MRCDAGDAGTVGLIVGEAARPRSVLSVDCVDCSECRAGDGQRERRGDSKVVSVRATEIRRRLRVTPLVDDSSRRRLRVARA